MGYGLKAYDNDLWKFIQVIFSPKLDARPVSKECLFDFRDRAIWIAARICTGHLSARTFGHLFSYIHVNDIIIITSVKVFLGGGLMNGRLLRLGVDVFSVNSDVYV